MYLRLLKKYFAIYSVDLIGHALLTNHTHKIAVPADKSSLEMGVGRMHRDYSKWHNIQHDRSGHLWQCRFYSCPVEDERIWQALAYVELNPVRAGLVQYAWDWEWSSAKAHVTGHDPTGLLNMEIWRKSFDPESWRRFLEVAVKDMQLTERIRATTRTGRPFCSEIMLDQLEQRFGRTLRLRKSGRKRKMSTST